MSDFVGTMKALDAAAKDFTTNEKGACNPLVSEEEVYDAYAHNGVSVEIYWEGQSDKKIGYRIGFVWCKEGSEDTVNDVDIHITGYFTQEISGGKLSQVSWEIEEWDAREAHRVDEWLTEWAIAA